MSRLHDIKPLDRLIHRSVYKKAYSCTEYWAVQCVWCLYGVCMWLDFDIKHGMKFHTSVTRHRVRCTITG